MSEDLLVDGYDYNPHTCMVEVPYNDYWDMKDRIINLKKENEYLQNQLQQKENIIKEVREKLNTQLAFTSSYQLNYQSAMSIIEEAKQILDKEVD